MSRSKKNGRTRKRPQSLRLLLVTGVPATGKTHMGNHLRDEHGFRHLDFENGPTRLHYLSGNEKAIRERIEELKREGRDVVITWGFVPDSQLPFALLLRKLGFLWIWFDGDREVARRKYLALSRSLSDWNVQLAKIEQKIDPQLSILAPTVISAFDAQGNRRPTEDIASELLG